MKREEIIEYNKGQLSKLFIYRSGNDTVKEFFREFIDCLADKMLKIEIYLNNTGMIHQYSIFILPSNTPRHPQARYVNNALAQMYTSGPYVKTEKCELFRQFSKLYGEIKEVMP
jgi:hypothetical protein